MKKGPEENGLGGIDRQVNRPGGSVDNYTLIDVKVDLDTGKEIGITIPNTLTRAGDAFIGFEEGESFAQITKEGIDELVDEGKIGLESAKNIKDRMSGHRASFFIKGDGTYVLVQKDPRYLDIINR